MKYYLYEVTNKAKHRDLIVASSADDARDVAMAANRAHKKANLTVVKTSRKGFQPKRRGFVWRRSYSKDSGYDLFSYAIKQNDSKYKYKIVNKEEYKLMKEHEQLLDLKDTVEFVLENPYDRIDLLKKKFKEINHGSSSRKTT